MANQNSRRLHVDAPDGGWGWMIVIATAIVQSVCGGLTQSLSPLFIAFRRYFDSSAEATSWILSALFFCVCLAQILGSLLANRVGHRITVVISGVVCSLGFLISSFAVNVPYLIGTFGVITGVGIAIGMAPAHAMNALYFERKFPIANSIVFIGSGLTIFVLPLLLQVFVDKYGWRGAVLLLSAISAHVIVAGSLLRPLPLRSPVGQSTGKCDHRDRELEDDETKPPKSKSRKEPCLSCRSCYVLKTYIQFSLSVIIFLFAIMGIYGTAVHFQSFAVYKHVASTQTAAWLVSIFGVSSLIGRLAIGIPLYFKVLSATTALIVSLLIMGMILLIPQLTDSFAGFVVLAVTLGTCSGVTLSLSGICTREYLGADKVIYGVPILYAGMGIGSMAGPPFAGWIYDITGVYDYSFYMLGCSFLLAGFVTIAGKYVEQRRKRVTKKKLSYTVDKYVENEMFVEDKGVQTHSYEFAENSL